MASGCCCCGVPACGVPACCCCCCLRRSLRTAAIPAAKLARRETLITHRECGWRTQRRRRAEPRLPFLHHVTHSQRRLILLSQHFLFPAEGNFTLSYNTKAVARSHPIETSPCSTFFAWEIGKGNLFFLLRKKGRNLTFVCAHLEARPSPRQAA